MKPKGLINVRRLNAVGHVQDKLDVRQEPGVANVFPDEQTILQAIHAGVFRQALIETAHWS